MFDTGSTGFMIVCAMLVLLMTPGLAFFYGGLSRRKNVVSTMIMSFEVLGIVGESGSGKSQTMYGRCAAGRSRTVATARYRSSGASIR